MPWGGFKRTDDLDLRAIYPYLMSSEPVEKETGPELQPMGMLKGEQAVKDVVAYINTMPAD